jgi:hypothetical protein
MSEPIAERLSRFTPEAAGLDRDALLFAAGRAAARPSRWWVAAACLLALSQGVTLICLWPRQPVPVSSAPAAPTTPAVQPSPADPPSTAEDPQPWAMTRQALTSGELPPYRGPKAFVPDRPPLRAFASGYSVHLE